MIVLLLSSIAVPSAVLAQDHAQNHSGHNMPVVEEAQKAKEIADSDPHAGHDMSSSQSAHKGRSRRSW